MRDLGWLTFIDFLQASADSLVWTTQHVNGLDERFIALVNIYQ
jgi:hypothetical protein